MNRSFQIIDLCRHSRSTIRHKPQKILLALKAFCKVWAKGFHFPISASRS
jgi:hypothetical protein